MDQTLDANSFLQNATPFYTLLERKSNPSRVCRVLNPASTHRILKAYILGPLSLDFKARTFQQFFYTMILSFLVLYYIYAHNKQTNFQQVAPYVPIRKVKERENPNIYPISLNKFNPRSTYLNKVKSKNQSDLIPSECSPLLHN